MNKPSFEQLIEYVINDEEAKARELFHQIVVEKSRTIYESLMDEDEQIDEDDAMGRTDRYDEAEMGGSQSKDLIDDVEAEEQGMQEAEDDEEIEVDSEEEFEVGDEDDHHADVGGDEELEDRVVDLEDKLDELMAEFEAMMGGDEMGSEMGDEMDSPDMTDMEVVDDEMETEGMGMGMAPIPMEEAVSLKAVPAPKHGDNGANTKSPVAFNSGAKGMAASPVKMTGDVAQGRPAPTAKDAIGKVGNTPAQGTQEPKPATKPHLAQATGVNTKSPLPKQ
jgi:hypothetical protein